VAEAKAKAKAEAEAEAVTVAPAAWPRLRRSRRRRPRRRKRTQFPGSVRVASKKGQLGRRLGPRLCLAGLLVLAGQLSAIGEQMGEIRQNNNCGELAEIVSGLAEWTRGRRLGRQELARDKS